MAVQYPITIEEMQNITGVGVGKARKFGEEFVKLIKAYVEEKEIIRPQDMIVKSVGNKSGNKIFIIQSIDRKMDFEDIARAKDLDFDELLTEIEGIVNSGTKLDISYYLRDFMDEDKIEDIYLYFRRTPRAIRSMRPSTNWGPTIRRRRYVWCALSLCASRATDAPGHLLSRGCCVTVPRIDTNLNNTPMNKKTFTVAVIFLIVTLVWLGVNIFWALSNSNCIFDLVVAVLLFVLAGVGMVYNEMWKRKRPAPRRGETNQKK